MTVVTRIEGLIRWEGESLTHFLWRVAERDGRARLPPEPPVMDETQSREEPGVEG